MNISIGQNWLNKKKPFEYIVPPSPLKWGSEQKYLLRSNVRMFKKSKHTQRLTQKSMLSLSQKPLSFTQSFPIPFSSARKISEQSSNMVKLIKKYDQLRRKRRKLIRLLKRDYSFSRVRSGLDAYFKEEHQLLKIFDGAEAKYGGVVAPK